MRLLRSLLSLTVVASVSAFYSPAQAQVDQQVERGFERFRSGDYRGAILIFDRVIKENPNHALALLNRCGASIQLAEATSETSYYQGAWKDCSKAIKIDPSLAVAFYNLCTIQLNLGGFPEAVQNCGRAIQKAPKFAPSYLNRCSAKVSLGQYESALSDCDEALALTPNLQSLMSTEGL